MRRSIIKPLLIAVILCMTATFTVAAKPAISSGTTDVVEAITTPIPQASPTTTPTPAPATTQPTPKVVTTKAAPKVSGNNLSIPSIGLVAPIVTVGTTSDNAIDVPAGRQVGYWTGSARPGTSGATFLDGHVQGIFAQLDKLTVGQTISVTYEGQTFNYRVVYREVVALDGINMYEALSVYGDDTEGLNIMTCAGTYIPSAGTYDRRLIVYTVRSN